MAKKKTVTVKTKNPSGLTISRKDNDITFKWKITDTNYGAGQQLQWRVNGKKWNSVSIGKTTTAKTVSVTLNNYRPNHTNSPLNSITFRVRGQRSTYTKGSGDKAVTYNPKWSDWVKKKLTLLKPRVPTAHATLSDSYDNVTTFSWSVNTSNTDHRFFRDVQYQTCLVKKSGNKGSAYDKKFGSTVSGASASGSFSKTEDSTLLAQNSYTRWYRFRSRGSKGNSNWKYVSHTYARPYQAVVEEATLNNGKVYVKWTAASPSSNKITSTTVQYAVATPDPGLECPAGASWTDATVSRDTEGTDAARFPVDQLPGLDECLWVRVNTTHDRNDTYGIPCLVDNGIGYLTDPSGLSVSTDDATHKAVVTATNNSAVTDSFLAITYRTESNPEDDLLVGIIPNGSSSVTVQCPNWDDIGNFAFGVQAVVGTYEDRSVDYGNYEIEPLMASQNIIWDGGSVPVAPSNVTAQATEYSGIVRVGWDWDWKDADIAVLSWSTEPTAWESTAEPSTFEINNSHAAQWYISGLETGMTWYIRVKLVKTNGDVRTEGPWSEMVALDLSSAPVVPVLELSSPVMTVDGDVTASWAYSSTDGTDQAYAEITTVEVNADGVWYGLYALTSDNSVVADKNYFSEAGGIYTLEEPVGTEDPEALGWYEIVPNIIAHTETAQHITLNAEELGWSAGDEYNLAVRVVSASGRMSDSWSDPVGVTVAEPITATIASSSLVYETYIDTADMSRDIYVLKAMPLDVTITGAGTGGTTTLAIERAASYYMERPDGTDYNGYEGETIALESQVGEDQITITLDNLIGRLDDGAAYRLVATVNDDVGQSDETTLDFEVHWTHQALMPTATATIDNTQYTAEITPVAPDAAYELTADNTVIVGKKYYELVGGSFEEVTPIGTEDPQAEGWYELTDVCDIYRLSADKPQLVVENGTFGTTYVDPYPTIGEFGGHRVVFKTANGDYITAAEHPAWVDLDETDGDILDLRYSVIDFDGNRLECDFNQSISNSFSKDFKETQYLGGSVQGDWNPAISRSSTVNTVFVNTYDPDAIRTLRALAAYPGICHVRTKDGSSYAADVQVGDEVSYDKAGKVVSASLTITRVDPEGYDGMSLADWEEGTS